MRTEKPSFRFRLDAFRRRFCSETGGVSSWLIIAAGLAAAAVLASTAMQATVTALAEEVALAAGGGASDRPAGAPPAPGSPTAPGDLGTSQGGSDLGALPTLESEGLTLTSRQSVVDGEEFLILEVSDEGGNVTELSPIQLRSDDRDGQASGGGAGDAQAATRPQDDLDDYTIDDYVADQAALGNEMHPISIAAAEVELDMIRDTFADSDPDIRDRVLDDIRNLGTAPVAHIVREGAEALPQDHYQDNLLGLIADTLFGWVRSPGRRPPIQIDPPRPIGIGPPSDSDYNPTPNDSDGDGVPNTIDNDFNPTPDDTDGDGVPNLIDPDTQPADPFDLDLGDPDPSPPEPSPPRPTIAQPSNDSDSDRDDEPGGQGTTSNPGNPDNPAGEPDECHSSCA